MKKWILLGVGALVLVGGAVGATVFVLGGKEPAVVAAGDPAAAMPAAPPEIFYYNLHPEFVVNLDGGRRGRQAFLMVEMSVATADEKSTAVIDDHSPELRNELLTLLAEQEVATLMTAEGKTALRERAREIIDTIVTRQYAPERVRDVFLTRFVIQ